MVDLERKEWSIVVHDMARTGRPRWPKSVTGLALVLALLGATAAPGVLAQDDGVAGGGASLEGTTASDIEAFVNSILAEILGEEAVVDNEVTADESVSTGGDLNVGGSTGGSVTMGGGMGGDISIGGASGGTSIGGTE